MKLKTLDALSITLLVLWTGMALGFAAVAAPALFKVLPSRDLAGQVAAVVVPRLDYAAFCVFGLALALSYGGRWLQEIGDALPIGHLRLWSFTAMVALLLTFASAFVVTPKIQEIRGRMNAPIETLAHEHPDRLAHRKAHGLSAQFMVIRMLLALGLAAGISKLPSEKTVKADSGS